jgi:hypothetical protein
MSGGASLLIEVALGLGLLSAALWWLGRRVNGPSGHRAAPAQSIRLNATDSLHVIEVEGRRLLVGTGSGAPPRLICELDAELSERRVA